MWREETREGWGVRVCDTGMGCGGEVAEVMIRSEAAGTAGTPRPGVRARRDGVAHLPHRQRSCRIRRPPTRPGTRSQLRKAPPPLSVTRSALIGQSPGAEGAGPQARACAHPWLVPSLGLQVSLAALQSGRGGDVPGLSLAWDSGSQVGRVPGPRRLAEVAGE